MCGIVGVIHGGGTLSKQDETKFNQLLEVGVLRGHDSTGVFSAGFKGGIKSHKDKWAAGLVIGDKEYNSVLLNATKLLVGHNRYATTGAVNAVNAHPFRRSDVTLVHNGTLHDTKGLAGHSSMEVDSEMICNELALAGVDEWAGVLERLDGAYALVWHDARTNVLRMARNNERPLTIAKVRAVGTAPSKLYFASEAGMLKWVLGRGTFKVVADYEELPVGSMLEVECSTGHTSTHPFTPLPTWETYYPGGYSNKNIKRLPYSKAKLVSPKGGPVVGKLYKFTIETIVHTNISSVARGTGENGQAFLSNVEGVIGAVVGASIEGKYSYTVGTGGDKEWRLMAPKAIKEGEVAWWECAGCTLGITEKEADHAMTATNGSIYHEDCYFELEGA